MIQAVKIKIKTLLYSFILAINTRKENFLLWLLQKRNSSKTLDGILMYYGFYKERHILELSSSQESNKNFKVVLSLIPYLNDMQEYNLILFDDLLPSEYYPSVIYGFLTLRKHFHLNARSSLLALQMIKENNHHNYKILKVKCAGLSKNNAFRIEFSKKENLLKY